MGKRKTAEEEKARAAVMRERAVQISQTRDAEQKAINDFTTIR